MSEKKVLIIDDDQTFANVMKDGLESVGFKAAVAFDALQGVMQAHSARPDVILLDFSMPAGGGANAYERLRASTATGRIPVVFTTASAVDEVKSQIRAGPRTYFLKKPVSLNQVRSVLLQVLGLPLDPTNPTPAPREAPPPVPDGKPAAEAGRPAVPDPVVDAPSGRASITLPPLPAAAPAPAPAPAAAASAPAAVEAAAPPPLPDAPPLPSIPNFANRASSPQIEVASPSLRSVFVAPEPPPPAVPAPVAGAASPAPEPSSDAGRGHEFEVRVLYGDTDKMGVIYYANYLKYFEQGRVELMRSIGIRYRDLETERKIFLPVVETRCVYKAPARYDELLIVRTRLARLGQASVVFSYEIVNRDAGGRLVASGSTRHAVVDDSWSPIGIPDDLRRHLEPHVNR
ncbi:MAG: YbgC/FadM family acyl-CoA thioesterase [Elusimicrobia bacterium]|nr:YbgC/FadM family acyl-CoA thioesterase [Elusimicrobiota bacterium]